MTLKRCIRSGLRCTPAGTVEIVGASRPEHLNGNAAASDARADPAHFAPAERILPEADTMNIRSLERRTSRPRGARR
jgi:hypothetical protein